MDFLIDQLRFLGLNDREIKVFTALSTFGRMKMTHIAARAGLPRTTVADIVRRLIEQGLVTPEEVGKHQEYSVELGEVAQKLDWLKQRLEPASSEMVEEEAYTDENDVISGVEPQKVLKSLFESHRDERVRMLLSAQLGVDPTVERLLAYAQYAYAAEARLEILSCARVADALREHGMTIGKEGKPHQVQIHVVPSVYCDTQGDTLMFRDMSVVYDVRSGELHAVDEPHIVEAMKHLLHIATETGWCMDLSTWVGSDT